jgi:hypothetical protein
MRSLAVILALLALAPDAGAQRRRVPSRAELGEAITRLEAQIVGLREGAHREGLTLSAETEARLAAIEKALAELRTQEPAGADRVQELADALDEVREEVATKADLKKYVRKPDEKEFRSRTAQELELRVSFTDLRAGEIEEVLAGLSLLAMAPASSERSRAIVAAATSLGELLLANDRRARPRLLFRATWETSRFISDDSYLFVSATPEIGLFVYEKDLDRALIPRDVAAQRARLGVTFKKAAAGAQLGRLGLQAGVLQFTYGSGFFLNPTNPFTPKSPLDPRRAVDGVPAAKLDLALVQQEGLTLTAQAAAIADRVRNDVLAERDDALGFGGLALIKLDARLASLTAIGIAQAPDAFGETTLAAGGIVSANPLGLTASVEGLVSERQEEWRPELVASIQGFTPKIGANGTTYILEYVFNGHNPASRAEASADLARAVSREQTFTVMDQLTRALGRRHYANLYLEPSLTPKLRVNAAALVGFDEAPGALLRGGLDYDLFNVTVHAFGGALVGGEDSEFNHHIIQAFAELAVFATF